MKIKQVFIAAAIYFYSFNITGQTLNAESSATVEKSLFNLQTGIFGIWASNEARLSNRIVLRSEIGLDAFSSLGPQKDVFALAPTINLEPRWYYNIEKRSNKGRNTQNNSANFLALSVKYAPDWFVISNRDNLNVYNQVYIIPKWGLRRNIGKSNFNYEFDFGIGYAYLEQYGYEKNYSDVAVDLHARIGYTFK